MQQKNRLTPQEAAELLPGLLSEELLAVLEVVTEVPTPRPTDNREELMWAHAQRAFYQHLYEILQNHVLSTQAAEGP